MRILAFGGWGQLGTDLSIAADAHELVRPTHRDVDITDARAVSDAVRDARPEAVVNLAAFHETELCEHDPTRAFAVNERGAGNVASAAAWAGARCVYVSTDYVFDGAREAGYAEDDPTDPLSVYGSSKVAGERAVSKLCPDSLVVRGSGLFGHAGSSGKGGNFVETMLTKAAEGTPLSVVDDQVFAPTSTRDMAARIVDLLERQAPTGIYHAANSGRCSWYGFAARIFELAGIRADLRPRRTRADEPVRRPACSVLLDTKGSMLGMAPARPWDEALAWYLASRGSGHRATA